MSSDIPFPMNVSFGFALFTLRSVTATVPADADTADEKMKIRSIGTREMNFMANLRAFGQLFVSP